MALAFLLVAASVTACLPWTSAVIYVPYVMEDTCDGLPRTVQLPATGPGSAIIVRSHQGAHYKSGLTCHFRVKTASAYRIVVVFETLQFPGNSANCSDSLLLANVEQPSGPICSSAVKEVISTDNVLNLTWTTGGGDAASVNDGFEAIVTAYKPGSAFCTFSEFKCANHRCIADNFACDGHNNCGDNSDEKCDFGAGIWRHLGSMSVLFVVIIVMGACMVVPLIARACYGPPDSQQQPPTCVVQQPDGVYRAVNAAPTPYPAMGPALDGTQQASAFAGQPSAFVGAAGIPVNLDTGRQMRFQEAPAELANVDYPRSVNPIVMSMPDASAPSLPDVFAEPPSGVRPNQLLGFNDLQQPFRAANAQMPQRQRTPLFQHSHPPLSLYDHPDPMRGFHGFGMGGPMGAPMMGGLGAPLGGPLGGPFAPRFPTFIIIEAADDDTDSQDTMFPRPPPTALATSASSSNQDTVFPTLLLQRRPQQAEEEDQRTPRRRHRHARRHGPGAASVTTPTADSEFQDAVQTNKDAKDEAKKQRQPPKAPASPAAAEAARPKLPASPAKKDGDKDGTETEKTVMRIDHIGTLNSAAAALHKLGLLSRPISAPSGNDCTAGGAAVAIRRAKSQWDAPLDRNQERNKIIYDLPSESTYEYASVWSNTTSTYSQTTLTTTETDASRGQHQTSADDSDVNYLRPTVSLENITVLDKAQQRERDLGEHQAAKKRV